MAIEQVDDNTFKTLSRGAAITLQRRADGGGWDVTVDNAAVRAWNSLGYKNFATLEEVERKYKSLAGISKLIDQRMSQ